MFKEKKKIIMPCAKGIFNYKLPLFLHTRAIKKRRKKKKKIQIRKLRVTRASIFIKKTYEKLHQSAKSVKQKSKIKNRCLKFTCKR